MVFLVSAEILPMAVLGGSRDAFQHQLSRKRVLCTVGNLGRSGVGIAYFGFEAVVLLVS
jgi:hypothetical protein